MTSISICCGANLKHFVDEVKAEFCQFGRFTLHGGAHFMRIITAVTDRAFALCLCSYSVYQVLLNNAVSEN